MPEVVGTPIVEAAYRAAAAGGTQECGYHSSRLGRWFSQRIYPSAEGITVLSIDVTDRRRKLETAERREERYRAFGAASQVLWAWDLPAGRASPRPPSSGGRR